MSNIAFYFLTYRPNLFKHLLTQDGQTVRETQLLQSLHQSSKQQIGQVYFHQQHFLLHEQNSYTKRIAGLVKRLTPYTRRISG